jgi:FkbM family methyltransferase
MECVDPSHYCQCVVVSLEKDVTANNFVDYLPLRPISAEAKFKLKNKYNINREFIFYIGGFDFRKNVMGLIEAFFLLPITLQKRFQLVIILSVDEAKIADFFSLLRQRWTFSDELILINYVSEDSLIALYNSCSLFVFASLHEGFGLPIIEAMACGAPTICSNISSMPEAIGCQEALFDPKTPQAIANKIAATLSNKNFLRFLKQHGQKQAKKFTWENSAKKALAAFEDLYMTKNNSAKTTIGINYRKKMAFISPLPPKKTVTANYSALLLPELARFYDIVLITDQTNIDDKWLNANFEIHNTNWFTHYADSFDIILYQFANAFQHHWMLTLLNDYPGIVILHDFSLSKLLNWTDLNSPNQSFIFNQSLYASHGYMALNYQKINGRDNSIKAYPCNFPLLNRALGIIVHSPDTINLVKKWYGTNIAQKFKFIPPIYLNKSPRSENKTARRADKSLLDIDYINQNHPAKIGDEYHRVINNFCLNPYFSEQALIKNLAEMKHHIINPEDLIDIANTMSANRSAINLPQLLLDISALIDEQAQENTSSIPYQVFLALMNSTESTYRLEPIYYHQAKNKYYYARKFTANTLSLSEHNLQDSVITINQDDIYLALSPPGRETLSIKASFDYWKAKGIKFYRFICEKPISMMDYLFTIIDACFCLKKEDIDPLIAYLNATDIKRKSALNIAAIDLLNTKNTISTLINRIHNNQWHNEWTEKTSGNLTKENFISRELYIDKIKYLFEGDVRYLGTQCEDYDPTLITIFKTFCHENACVLDLGANIGITSIALANICKKGKVAAVEPVPITFKMLQSNVKKANLNNISLHNFAIGNKKGEIAMQLRTDFLAGAFVADRYQADYQHQTVNVNIECLDDIFDQFGYNRLDFIKMDLEGYELFALEGAKKTINKFKPIVYLEMNHWCLNVFYRITLPEFKERLQSLFPYIFAIEYPSYLDFTTVDNFYHIAHEHITTTRKYFNLIAGFDRDAIMERFYATNMLSMAV